MDLAPLRGRRDLLDVTGCLPDGWLVGAKSVANGVSAGSKMRDGNDQSARAMETLAARGDDAEVIPWQVIQRRGVPIGRSYVVTEFDHMLRLVAMRRKGWTRF